MTQPKRSTRGRRLGLKRSLEITRADAPGGPLAIEPEKCWHLKIGRMPQTTVSTETLRTMIDEGRLPTDALLSRDGWANHWRIARDLFPQLASA
jgi:hypothetical protein